MPAAPGTLTAPPPPTPGPWAWRWKDNSLRVLGDGKPYPFTNQVILRLAQHDEGEPISDADAALVAAAPDLLAALRLMAAAYARDGFMDRGLELRAQDAARAAIARAEGR